ncbi:hypothetical protein ACFZDJ_37400 [Streptomyces sp. NPDC007896]|uniref:hypothetical protein n=1 Tax=Streptomyces sp. NPDC007896 TaxID=3364784 RepID=UPI0036EE565A
MCAATPAPWCPGTGCPAPVTSRTGAPTSAITDFTPSTPVIRSASEARSGTRSGSGWDSFTVDPSRSLKVSSTSWRPVTTTSAAAYRSGEDPARMPDSSRIPHALRTAAPSSRATKVPTKPPLRALSVSRARLSIRRPSAGRP